MESDLPEQNGQLDHGVTIVESVGPAELAYESSISFSSPGRSEPDSDFATDGAARKAGQSRPGSSDGEASDDSTYGAKKRWQTVAVADFTAWRSFGNSSAFWVPLILSGSFHWLCASDHNAMHDMQSQCLTPRRKTAIIIVCTLYQEEAQDTPRKASQAGTSRDRK